MANNDLELIDKYCNKALKILKQNSIPAFPKFYDLLYTYSNGTNIGLNNKLNDKLSAGDSLTIQFVEGLYSEFLSSNGVEDRLSSVTDEILDSISNIHNTIDKARTNNSNYTEMLDDTVADLKEDNDQEALNNLTVKLLNMTKEVQAANMLLENELASAKSDISSLKDEVDEVRQDALLDPLTNIDNRKSFDSFLKNALKLAEDSKEEFSLVMIDIDHFKKFNDTWGHQTGDQVLRLVGATLKSGTREEDLAARYGGEEFALILPNADLDQATNIAEKVRKSIMNRKLHKRSTNEDLGRITVSCGTATYRAGDDIETIVERADKCLYAAKHAGRNKVIREDSELVKEHSKVA